MRLRTCALLDNDDCENVDVDVLRIRRSYTAITKRFESQSDNLLTAVEEQRRR